jgi:predicted RNase H-like nuclease (RuvC/YqgF family)
VSREGARSGVWRVPQNNPNAHNYHVIVEAVTADGKRLAVPAFLDRQKRAPAELENKLEQAKQNQQRLEQQRESRIKARDEAVEAFQHKLENSKAKLEQDQKTQGRTIPFGKLRACACRKQPGGITKEAAVWNDELRNKLGPSSQLEN